MSMEVTGNYKDCKNDYCESVKESKDWTKETINKSENIPIFKDEYISGEKSGSRPSGLYHMGKDKNGNPKVLYDNPHKKERTAPDRVTPAGGDDRPEKCTTNTDTVDKEIERLKEEKRQLEQQLRSVNGDEKKKSELEHRLAQIKSELMKKDNDTYRRQQATVTNVTAPMQSKVQ